MCGFILEILGFVFAVERLWDFGFGRVVLAHLFFFDLFWRVCCFADFVLGLWVVWLMLSWIF